jgi:hypothetical protein
LENKNQNFGESFKERFLAFLDAPDPSDLLQTIDSQSEEGTRLGLTGTKKKLDALSHFEKKCQKEIDEAMKSIDESEKGMSSFDLPPGHFDNFRVSVKQSLKLFEKEGKNRVK